MSVENGVASLKARFEERASDEPLRRFVYGHDMGVLPDAIKKFIANTPAVVVQPETVEELSEIVKVACTENLPITPRGGASGGYGGAVPVSSGIVIDMVRMSGLLSVDRSSMTATAKAGTVLKDLDDELKKLGLALPLYPSSAPSATIGGFVAQGGAGIGSCSEGTMRDNLYSLQLVLGDGTIREISGEELDYVYAMEGITGVIASVSFRVVEDRQHMMAAFGCQNAEQAQALVQRAAQLGAWHLNVQPPTFVSLKNRACGTKTAEQWLVFVVSDKIDELAPLAKYIGAVSYGTDVALHEWDERFYPLRGKKFGPSIIPVDVVIPIAKLSAFADAMSKKFEDAFVYEGSAIGGEELALIGFILADERQDNFTLSFANSLVINEAAKKLGGRAYATGIYLTAEAEAIFGAGVLAETVEFKRRTDAMGIMNPGKVLPPSLDPGSPSKRIAKAIGTSRSLAGIGSALSRILGGAQSKVKQISDLPNDMENSAFACAACGFCRSKCTVYLPNLWEDNSPRGKWYMLKEYAKGNIPFDLPLASRVNLCTTCKRCEFSCEVDLKMADEYLGAKPYLFAAKGFDNAGLAALRGNVISTGNFWGADLEGIAWEDDDMEFAETGELGFWPGCWSETVTKNAAQNVVRLLNAAGIKPVDLSNGTDACCGFYLLAGGYMEDYSSRVAQNVLRMNEKGIKTLITPCPACLAAFKESYKAVAQSQGVACDITFMHSVTYLNDLVKAGKLSFPAQASEASAKTVTYHDPCHLGRWFGEYDTPREFIKAIPGIELKEMEHNRDDALCCGLVSAFYMISNVPVSGAWRIAEAEATNADYLLTACSGCGCQLNSSASANGAKVEQHDITDIAAEAMGFDVFNPNDLVAAYMGAAVDLLSTSKTIERSDSA